MIYTIERPKNFDLEHIFDCGQCFRFNKHKEKMNTYCGVAFGKYLEVSQDYNNVYFHNTTEEDYKNCWNNFFDMECDYNSIISSFKDDKTLADAAAFSSGIRILRQAPWETLCSFI
ncbi:MAG: 8-oxoguanine DNA glycosylase, N-terminal domain-containing protein, partial [Clostridia bacterium]|nr:8-oxoguanine DNA glycosylase, N-terminal domain-containing protein [Clostridia bacterium]